MDNNDRERKKVNRELINFAIQGMGENAQFTVAIAVGIFRILATFVSLDTHKNMTAEDVFWKNALWTQSKWIWFTGLFVSVAYWVLVLFGIQTYVSRLYEGIMGDYQKKLNEEWYYNDIEEIAKENKLANWLVKEISSSNHERKDRTCDIVSIYLSLYKII